jgi:uroporphyrinogen-III synthase
MRVLLTRARDRCEKTAEKLAAAGHEAIILPLSQYEDSEAPLPEGRFDAVAFTSAAGVESLSRRIGKDPSLESLRLLPAFCVGDATAQCAGEHGFAHVRNAQGDGEELAALILREGPAAGRLLHPTQPGRAFDLAAALPGWEVRQFEAYEASLLDPGPEAFVAAIKACNVGFLYSPRNASHFVDLLVKHVTQGELPRLTLIAISEKTARAARAGFSDDLAADARFRILVAGRPDEDAMIELLGDPQTNAAAGPALPEDEEDMMNEKKGQSRRTGKPRTIDLSATEIARAEEQAAQEAGFDAPVTETAEAQATSAREDMIAETSTEAQGAVEPASEPVNESAGEAPGAADATPGAEAPAQPEMMTAQTASAEKSERKRGAGPLGLLTAGIIGGVVAIGGLGALNASGAIGAIPGLKGLFAPAPPPSGSGVDLAALQSRVAALESAPAPAAPAVDPARVEALESRIGAVETQASQLREALATAPAATGEAPAPNPELTARLERLEGTVAELSSAAENAGNGNADSAVITQLSGKVDAGLESVDNALAQTGEKIAVIENRVATIEQTVAQMAKEAQQEAASGKGAAQMIAANALRSAAAEGRPFDELIPSVEALTGSNPQLESLKAQAATGLATPASLAASFEPAADAILAVDAPKPQGIVDGLLANAKSLIKVQPQGPVAGDSPEAIVSQIRAALAAGNLAEAYGLWEKLPQAQRAASAQWGEKLKARLEEGKALDAVLQSLTPDAG